MRRPLLGLCWLVGMGCGPAAPPTVASTQAVAPAASASAPSPDDAPEGGAGPTPLPVEAPRNLLVAARSRPVADVARELGKLVGMPIEMMLGLVGRDVMRFDASLGAVVLLDPSGGDDESPGLQAAFSVPVRGEEAFATLAARDTDLWRARGVGFGIKRGPLEGAFCKTVASLGDAPVRLVCGRNEQDVAAVAPYLTRGLPQAEMQGGDVRVEVKFGPLKGRYLGPMRERQEQASTLAFGGGLLLGGVMDPGVLSAPGAVMDEGVRFAEALDGLSVGMTVEGQAQQLALDGQLRIGSRSQSWLVKVLTSRSDRGQAPALFWQLPRSSQVAVWGRGIDASLLEEPRKVLRRATSLLLERFDVDAGDRKAIDEAIVAFPQGDRPWGLGMGTSGEGDAARGWWLLGSEAPSAVYGTWLRKTGQAIRRGVAAATKVGLTGVADAKPVARVEESPAGFPAGSVLLELSGRYEMPAAMQAAMGNTAPATPRMDVLAIAVPDGRGQSWLALGTERAVLRARVAEAMSRAPKDGQIASLPEADAHRGDAASFGGVLALGDAVGEAMRAPGGPAKSRKGPSVPVWLTGEIEPSRIGVKGRLSARGLSDLAGMFGGLLGR